jgi:hypothetical protein
LYRTPLTCSLFPDLSLWLLLPILENNVTCTEKKLHPSPVKIVITLSGDYDNETSTLVGARGISSPLALRFLVLLMSFGAPALPASALSPAFVRVIHASPDVGAADVFVDGAKLLSSFQFGSVTGYVQVPPGPHHVQIALVGKGINAAVISQTLAVSAGVAYTVAAVGTNATGNVPLFLSPAQ